MITDDINRNKFIEDEFLIRAKEEQENQMGYIVPFKLNKVQRKYYDLLMQGYSNNLDGAREIILKARQQGFSSFILALFTVDFITKPNSRSVCISYRSSETKRLFKRVRFYIESFCDKNKFKIKDYLSVDTKEELENATNGASFYIGTAGAKVGGRGDTISNLHFCLSGNQQVIGKDGFVYFIKDIKKGKEIIDGEGKAIKVFDLAEKECDEDMKRIYVAGNMSSPIEATIRHKFLCRRGKGRYNKMCNPAWKQVKDITTEDYLAFPLSKISRRKSNKMVAFGNLRMEMSEVFGEFCGWYLSEGCLNIGRIDLSVNKKEKDYVLKLVKRLSGSYSSVSVYERKTNSFDISIFGTELRNFMENNFGEKNSKFIPDKVFDYGKQFLRGLVRGLFLGDGTFSSYKQSSFASIRPQMVIQLKRIIISLRIGYPSIFIKKTVFRQGRNEKECWFLILTGKTYTRLRNFLGMDIEKRQDHREKGYYKYFITGEKYYWAKIKKIEKLKRQNKVYDIVLDKKPHSFCLTSGVSSNSEAAFFEDTDKITAKEIIEATMQQVPQDHGMVFVESTGGQYGSYYQRIWEKAKKGDSNFSPRFFSWKEFYSKKWIEKKRKDFDSEEEFKSHYPNDDTEAFLFSGRPFFNVLALQELIESTKEIMPIYQGRLAPDGELL